MREKRAYLKSDRIVLDFDYDARLIAFVKTLDGRKYHPGDKVWSIPLTNSHVVLPKLERLGFDIDDWLMAAIDDERKAAAKLEQLSRQSDVEFKTNLPLFPYQKVGAAFLRQAKSALLGDEMGLGKTIQALALVEKAKHTLIVCPAALKYQWADEIKKFLKTDDLIVIDGTKEERFKQWRKIKLYTIKGKDGFYKKAYRFYIVNYELLIRDDFEPMSRAKWDYIIADEATKISNPKAQQSKAIKKLKAKHRIAMTGTPISNKAQEVWNIMDFCRPGMLSGFWEFQQRYCVKDHWGAIIDYQNLEELNAKLKRYMIRRMKSDVALDLPDKTVVDVPVKLSDKERKLYNKIREEILFEIESHELDKVENPTTIQFTIVKMLRLMQLSSHMSLLGEGEQSSKLDTLKELMSEVPAGDKMIVFTRFAEMANILNLELTGDGYQPLVISGQTKEEYHKVVEKFNKQPNRRVLIMTSAGQYGLNIQAANVLFHYDMEWSLAKMEQRTGRAHRIGQKKNVLVYNLLARGTLDMYVRRVLHAKAELSERMLGDSPQISFNEIREMLEYGEEN